MKTLSRIYTAIIFLFLYSPIAVLIAFSFNNSKNRVKWNGFTLKWYADLFHNELILDALRVTLEIAVLAAVISTVIGTLAAIGIHSMNGKMRNMFLAVNNIPMVNPEIVTGISMMLMFVFIFRLTGILRPGFFTLLLSHITFCIPYVNMLIMPSTSAPASRNALTASSTLPPVEIRSSITTTFSPCTGLPSIWFLRPWSLLSERT